VLSDRTTDRTDGAAEQNTVEQRERGEGQVSGAGVTQPVLLLLLLLAVGTRPLVN